MYFNHPYALRNTPEILELRATLGFESYSIYLMVLETIAESPEQSINGKLINGLSISFGCDPDFLKKVLTKATELKLFFVKGDFIYSKHLEDHFEKRAEIKEKRATAGAKGGKAKANAKQTLANAKQNVPKESKVKKVNIKDKIKYKENIYLFESEFLTLVEKYTEPVVNQFIEILSNYKNSIGKTYKSDYHAILTWVVDKYNQQKAKPNFNQITPTASSNYPPVDIYQYDDESIEEFQERANKRQLDNPDKRYNLHYTEKTVVNNEFLAMKQALKDKMKI
jgi:hypothetical protein